MSYPFSGYSGCPYYTTSTAINQVCMKTMVITWHYRSRTLSRGTDNVTSSDETDSFNDQSIGKNLVSSLRRMDTVPKHILCSITTSPRGILIAQQRCRLHRPGPTATSACFSKTWTIIIISVEASITEWWIFFPSHFNIVFLLGF